MVLVRAVTRERTMCSTQWADATCSPPWTVWKRLCGLMVTWTGRSDKPRPRLSDHSEPARLHVRLKRPSMASQQHGKMRSDVRFIKAGENAFGSAIVSLRTQMTTASTCHTGVDAIKLLREFIRVPLHHTQL